LITVAVGNLLVAAMAEIHWPKSQMASYFFYAILMAVFDVLFLVINRNYTYRNNLQSIDEVDNPSAIAVSDVPIADNGYGSVDNDVLILDDDVESK
jgi:hypothetical protein